MTLAKQATITQHLNSNEFKMFKVLRPNAAVNAILNKRAQVQLNRNYQLHHTNLRDLL